MKAKVLYLQVSLIFNKKSDTVPISVPFLQAKKYHFVEGYNIGSMQVQTHENFILNLTALKVCYHDKF